MTPPADTPNATGHPTQEGTETMRQMRAGMWQELLTDAGVNVDPSFLAEHITWSPWIDENRYQDEPLPLESGAGKLCVVGVGADTYFSLRIGYRNTGITRAEAVDLLRTHKDHVEQLTRHEQELSSRLHQSTDTPPVTQGKTLNELTTDDIVLMPSRDGSGWELGRVRNIDHYRFTYQKADRTYREVHAHSNQQIRVIDHSGKERDADTLAQYQQECRDFLTHWHANETAIAEALNSTFSDANAHQLLESSMVKEDDVVLVNVSDGRWMPARVYGVTGTNAKLVTSAGSTLEVQCGNGHLLKIVKRGPSSRGEQPVNPPGWTSEALGERPTEPPVRENIRIPGGHLRQPLSHAD